MAYICTGTFILCLLLFLPAALAEEPACPLYIKAVPDLPEDFALGMDVTCSGSGAWGKIDDAKLNTLREAP